MTLTITKSTLLSRVIRSSIGPRTLNTSLEVGEETTDSLGGRFVRWVAGGVLGLGKWILKVVVGGFKFSLVALVGWLFQGVQFLWNFDWSTTDAQLDRLIKTQADSLKLLLSGAAGNLVGWVACGFAPGITIFAFNKAMGMYLLKELGEEALDELAGNMASVIQAGVRTASLWLFVNTFKTVRRAFRLQPDTALRLFNPEVSDSFGKESTGPRSLAQGFENWQKRTFNPQVQPLAEEFFEEVWDGCVEAGFALAQSVENYWAAEKLAQKSALGPNRVLEIQPDRSNPGERIIVAGPDKLIRPQVVQTLTQHQLLDNRDLGQFVGQPVPDFVRANAMGLRLEIILYAQPRPPYGRIKSVVVSIPDVNRARLDWSTIKQACGGVNGYTWGRFKANALLDNNRRLIVYGATETEAENQLKKFLTLSTATLKTLSVTEEKKEGSRLTYGSLYKEPTRIYPGYVTVLNRERQLAIDRGQVSSSGRYIDKKTRLELWTDSKPDYWEEAIQELLRRADGI